MPFVANFPLFCIVLTLAGSVTTSVLNGKNAFRLNTVIISLCLVSITYILPFTSLYFDFLF